MNKKGVFFTIDAMIAILATIILITMAFFYLGQLNIKEVGNNELLEYSKSVMAVMEENETFDNVILVGSSVGEEFLENYTKSSTCFNVTIYDQDLVDQDLGFKKLDCGNYSENIVVYRSFITDDEIYMAKMEAYYE